MPAADYPPWLEQIDLNDVAALTLDDGERVIADILEFNEDRDELIVDIVSSNRSSPNSGQRRRAIPINRVISVEPQPRAAQPWPFSDPCRLTAFSLARFVTMATLFLSLTLGSLPLYFLLTETPYGLQEASAIIYTLFVVFFTFAGTGKFRPYTFNCPAVRSQASRLFWRHPGFLVVLLVLQAAALAARPNLPYWWITESGARGETPFDVALFLVCFSLGWAQVLTNRSVLDRAHRELTP